MIVGITGHQILADAAGWTWVRAALLAELSEVPPPLIGCSSLAAGADQIFAELVLSYGPSSRLPPTKKPLSQKATSRLFDPCASG